MAAENCEITCLLGAMDCLWFHHTILFSKHSLSLGPEIPKTPLPISESPHYSSRNSSSSQESQLSDQETSSVASVITTCSQDEARRSCFQESDHDKQTTTHDDDEERRSRSYLVLNQTGSHRSSPVSARKQSRHLGHSVFSAGRLQKSMSCKSLGELELEEVKGFMDLGFTFKKENLSEHVMNLVPGLKRIDSCDLKEKDSWDRFGFKNNADNVEDDEEKKEVMMRPYLSEARLIKRPDSPLLNLRVPRVSATEDMKKHLKDWARTVASAIQQES